MHPLKGKSVVVMGANYIYCGTLGEVAPDHVTLEEPSIIYETGPWEAGKKLKKGETRWKDVQRLPTDLIFIERTAVESLFAVD